MAIIVQKFGGTSVANIERIKIVAQYIKLEVDKGNQVAVVVSAMNGTTDQLISWVKDVIALNDEFAWQEYDSVVASGEQVTCGLVALALRALGINSRSWQGWQLPIETDFSYGKARIEQINIEPLLEGFSRNEVGVIAGFQGVAPTNRITTLGRGGSDTSALALAAALNAKRCDIFTDVEGVYTADPRIVHKARKLDKVSYEEMLEMASLGAKVLHTRSVVMAMKYHIAVQVLSSFSNNPGTLLVDEDSEMEKRLITSITYSKDEAMLALCQLPDSPVVLAEIFGPLADADINVDMIVKTVSKPGSYSDITFTVSKTDLDKTLSLLEVAKEKIKYQTFEVNSDITKISIIGVGMRSHSGVAKQMFQVLADKGINILAVSTSEIKTSVLISAEYMELALRALHSACGLDAA
jgi:aspartate kinase